MDGSFFAPRTSQDVTHSEAQELCQFGLTARLALTPSTMHEAWHLRHESYLAHGLIDPKPGSLFADAYDRPETARTVVLYENGIPVGSVRACLHDPEAANDGSPTMPGYEIFPDVIPELLKGFGSPARPPRVTEVSRLVCLPSRASDSKIAWALMRMGKCMTELLNTELTLISARTRHVPMYRRIGFHKVADPRQYAGVRFETALLLGVKSDYDVVQQRFPAMATVQSNDQWLCSLEAGDTVPVFPITINPSQGMTQIKEESISQQNYVSG